MLTHMLPDVPGASKGISIGDASLEGHGCDGERFRVLPSEEGTISEEHIASPNLKKKNDISSQLFVWISEC